MTALRIIGYLAAIILIFFGIMYIMAASSLGPSRIFTGVILVLIGIGIFLLLSRKKSSGKEAEDVTYKVDLGGDVKLESMKCQSCGGQLSPENVKMLAGAPVVTCPYCGVSYQLTEEPKW